MTVKRDAYEVLGVSRDADDREIKRSFRRLARELHPDVNRHDHDAEERFKEAADAYEILSDPDRRQLYDRYGHEGLSSQGREPSFSGFGSVADIFEAFFGGGDPFGGGGGGRSAGVQGGDVAVAAEISLADAARGKSVKVEYEAVAACERCHGNGAEPGTPIETCGRCGGSGQLRTAMRSAFGQVIRAHVCDACGGDAFGGGGRRSAGVQGGDVAVAAEVSLAEAARGTTVGVEYEVVAPCERCQGNAAEPGTPIETCARCGGTGELRTAMRSAFGQVIRAHLCDACGGDG
ncbi:MAG: DnaJ domain-containing protein, partial [Thermoleophilaceae bacterium]|nr:DnaJ domain-containing protein [Thermoleophilaceae bacterium]